LGKLVEISGSWHFFVPDIGIITVGAFSTGIATGVDTGAATGGDITVGGGRSREVLAGAVSIFSEAVGDSTGFKFAQSHFFGSLTGVATLIILFYFFFL
jgi:hypothetical protein